MNSSLVSPARSGLLRTRSLRQLGAGCALALGCLSAQAGLGILAPPLFEWDIELTSMDLNVHNAQMPLGPGWSDILVDIHIGESVALASKGKAFAYSPVPPAPGQPVALPQNGDPLFVESFFDVFFDISITDVDPSINFGGGPTDGLSMLFPDNGPAHMQNFYSALVDLNAPNFGLIPPPEAAPYIGHFSIEIPLGVDLNGNGPNDKIKFTLVAHSVGDENRTFITLPDGTVVDSFDSVLDLSGAVVDELDDPPFTVSLTGPTTATSVLTSSIFVPEPVTGGAGVLLGLLGMSVWLRRQAGKKA